MRVPKTDQSVVRSPVQHVETPDTSRSSRGTHRQPAPGGLWRGAWWRSTWPLGTKRLSDISTARQIPMHWKERAVSAGLQKLIQERVITQQDQPTDWCAPGFFVVKKNGDLRLVVDYTHLNQYVRRPVHTFPSTQEIISGLDPGSKVFAKLDSTQGHHQVPLSEDSSKLTTFLLPSGRFRVLRAPHGTVMLQRWILQVLGQGHRGAAWGKEAGGRHSSPGSRSLCSRINKLIERCKSHNFTLSKRKLEIGSSVEFAGQVISEHGVRPNPKFLQGLCDFPRPASVQELRSFLGMVNQIASYHPHVARHTGILQALLKKDMAFLWLDDHPTAFDRLKHEVISTLALNHFDVRWPTKLVTDASRLNRLGFVLMQQREGNTKIIQCGLRWLSPAERNYSMLELELTAIVYGIQKCNYFLKGLDKFEVVTDHRPLVGIFKKLLPQIYNSRIVRLCEKILDYSFEVQWLPGKHNIIANALSRAPALTTEGWTFLPLYSCIIAPASTMELLRSSAETCPAYKATRMAFQAGTSQLDLHPDHQAKQIKDVWHSLSLAEDGILMVNGNRIYVPPRSTEDNLNRASHQPLWLRQTIGHSETIILLAGDEIWHSRVDWQMQGVPTAQAEETCRTSNHHKGPLSDGNDFHRPISRGQEDLNGYSRLM